MSSTLQKPLLLKVIIGSAPLTKWNTFATGTSLCPFMHNLTMEIWAAGAVCVCHQCTLVCWSLCVHDTVYFLHNCVYFIDLALYIIVSIIFFSNLCLLHALIVLFLRLWTQKIKCDCVVLFTVLVTFLFSICMEKCCCRGDLKRKSETDKHCVCPYQCLSVPCMYSPLIN